MSTSPPLDSGSQIVFQDETVVITRYTSADIANIVDAPISVSTAAVIKRINRRLVKYGKQLHACRRYCPQLGRYYVKDIYLNAATDLNVDLDHLARDLGVLNEDEHIGD